MCDVDHEETSTKLLQLLLFDSSSLKSMKLVKGEKKLSIVLLLLFFEEGVDELVDREVAAAPTDASRPRVGDPFEVWNVEKTASNEIEARDALLDPDRSLIEGTGEGMTIPSSSLRTQSNLS